MITMRKLTIFLPILLLFLCVALSTVSATEWTYTDANYSSLMKITIASNSEINADVNGTPIFLNFNSASDDFWTYRGDDDEDDARFYMWNASGSGFGTTETECPYEVIDFNESTHIYQVYVKTTHLEDGTDTDNVLYMYFNRGSDGDFDNTSGVWTNAESIYHNQANANDSVGGNNGNVSDATITPAFVGNGLLFDANAEYVKYPVSTAFNSDVYTVIILSKVSSTSNVNFLAQPRQTTPNDAGEGMGVVDCKIDATHRGYMPRFYNKQVLGGHTREGFVESFVIDDTDYILYTGTSSAESDYNSEYYTFWVNHTKITDFTASFAASGTIDSYHLSIGDWLGIVDEVWIFTDVKPDNYINIVSYNIEDYAGLIETEIVPPDNIPLFTSPANGSVVDNLKATVEWDAVAGAVSYDVRYDTDSNMSDGVQLTGLVDTYTLNYLSNDTYWFDVRAKFGPASYSAWYTDFYDPLIFTKNDKPVFSKPDANETSANVLFEWSDISDFTEYELRVFTDAGLTALYTNSSPTDNEDTLTLVNDDYWAEVRAKDNYYTGAWSDARAFNLLIAAVPFTSTPNCVNLYVGDTLQYDFSGMDVNATYTFKINRIDTSGNFVSTTTTKTVVGDADGNGSFTYVFPADSYYPFEVRYHESNAQIYKHFVAPRPSNLYGWTITGHRVQWGGNVMSVAIGDVAYNNWTGLLHDPYNSIESLYETDDYVLLHYSILPRDTNISSVIDITNLDTGVTYLSISSKDLHNYEFNGTYCNRNFIVIPLDGVMPDFVEADFELVDYEAIDFEWYNNIFNKGAYDYVQYVSDADEVPNFWEGGGWENGDLTALSYGESVMLIGDDDTVEWSVTPTLNPLIAGNEETWTITCNTENIWNAYNQMYFRDKSSDTYYLGGAGTFETYPSAYAPSFTIKYNVEEGIGGAIYRVSPQQLNWYLSAGNLVNYDYIFDKSITITDAVDSTEVVDDWLDIAGLNTANGKLIVAMIALIIIVTAMALLGVPVALVAMIALAVVIIFTTLGFIPIWVIVLIGIAMVLLLIRSFSGGGGGGGGDE